MSAASGSDGVKKSFDLNLISDADLKREADKIRKAKSLAKDRDGLPKEGSSTSVAPTSSKDRQRERELTKRERELKKRQRKIDKKLKELDTKVQKITDQAGDFLSNPQSAVQNQILSLAKKAGPAGIAVGLSQQLIQEILKEFEPGGVFDTRIKEQSDVKTIAQLDYLLDIQNGTVIFSEQAFLTNEPPIISNTDKLVAGQMRFYQFNSGDYTGIVD